MHGRHDPVVGIETVQDFASRHGARVTLNVQPTQGQLLLHADPAFVIDALARIP